MTIEDRLFDIFDKKLTEIEDRIDSRISPRWRTLSTLQSEWSEFLKRVPSITVMSKIVGLVTNKKEGDVRFNDPLVVGGNQGVISMSRDMAMKIATLGHIPEASE